MTRPGALVLADARGLRLPVRRRALRCQGQVCATRQMAPLGPSPANGLRRRVSSAGLRLKAPSVFKGKLYGRGTTDNKGPVLAWMNAVSAFRALGEVGGL